MRTRAIVRGHAGRRDHMGAVVIGAGLLLITGCATKLQTYSGAPLPREAVAIVKVSKLVDTPGLTLSRILCVKEIDGTEPRDDCLTYRYELLPGKHSMTFSIGERWYSGPFSMPPQGDWIGCDIFTQFTVEGGKKYFTRSRVLELSKTWMVEILDECSGRTVATRTEKAWQTRLSIPSIAF